jgi:hypothetical protein
MSTSNSCVQLLAPWLQDASPGPVTGTLPGGLPPPRDQQRTVHD